MVRTTPARGEEGFSKAIGRAEAASQSPGRYASRAGVLSLVTILPPLFLFLFLFLLLGPASLCARSGEARPPLPAEALADLDAALAERVEELDIPGLAVSLVDREDVLFRGYYGYADPAAVRPVTPRTLFRAGSITKPFVAALMLRFVDRGALRLEDRLDELAPDLPIRNPWRETHPLTLAHLLEHTSGLDDTHFDEVMDSSMREDRPMKEVLLRNPEHLRVRWQPGSRFSYCNRGYMIAAHVLERHAGRPFEALLREEVLAPLDISRAALRLDAVDREGLARGHLGDASRPVPYRPAWFRAAANLMIDLDGLGRFVRMLLRRGELDGRRLLSRESVRRMEEGRTSPAARAGLEVGAGAGIAARCPRDLVTLGHYGGGYAFSSIFQYLPGQGVGYVIMMNTSHRADAFAAIQDLVYEVATQGVPRHPAPAVHLPAEELARLTGTYRQANPWYSVTRVVEYPLAWLRLELEEGELRVHHPLQEPEPLIPVAANRFRRENEPVATLFFEPSPEGPLALVGGDIYFVRSPWSLPIRVRDALVASLAVILLYLVAWPIRRGRGGDGPRSEAAPAALGLLLLAVLWNGYWLEYHDLGQLNARTAALSALTGLYGLATPLVLARVVLARLRPPAAERPWWPALLASLAHGAVALYLAWWGMIGVRLWAD